MKSILERIDSPKDLRKLNNEELSTLALEIREYIIEVVSHNGGHLAPSLGVVDLTIALHKVFDTPKDRIIWDVGHQSYAHKIITGRRKEFATLRTFGGISGFPKVSESPYDTYNTGHSSTSLSLAIGEAVARDCLHKKYQVIALIGDGALTGGMCWEALNQIGHLDKDMIIILNDNDHSIAKNVGAISSYLTRVISGSWYNAVRTRYHHFLRRGPLGKPLWKLFYKVESRIKGLILPGQIFEELGVRYFGPIDGHNIAEMCELFERLKQVEPGPKMVHVITRKGKGYLPAEKNPSRFHGIGPFDKETGLSLAAKQITYSEVAGKTLAHYGKLDKRIVTITAAMRDGTGLSYFEEALPGRLYDVGIAESHAVTFASALAKNGMKPFVALYSTFVQRAVDQLIHDVGIMNLPVTFLIDRAGVVGDDGETHHGLFDLSLIRAIPNFTILAPANGAELRDMISFAATRESGTGGPLMIRYPRGKIPEAHIDYTKCVLKNFFPTEVAHGNGLLLIALGDMTDHAKLVSGYLSEKGIDSAVISLRSAKPLHIDKINRFVRNVDYFVTFENGNCMGGIGEEIVTALPYDQKSKFLFQVGFPDLFVTHGKKDELFNTYSISAEKIAQRIMRAITDR